MFSKSIFQSKTFYTFMVAVLGAWGTYFQGTMTLNEALGATIMAAVAVGMRLVSNGPVHVVTPQTATQDGPGAPVVKSPVPPNQAGNAHMGVLLAVMALSLATACATTGVPSSAVDAAKTAAYAAHTTADLAVKAIPSLLATKTISKATAVQINNAALDVNVAVAAVYACTAAATTAPACSTAALTAALSELTPLIPAATSPK